MDLEPVGADVSGESELNVDPASGLDPTRQVKYVGTAAQSVYPNVSMAITSPLTSGDVQPKVAAPLQIVPDVGQNVKAAPVDLQPPNAVANLKAMAQGKPGLMMQATDTSTPPAQQQARTGQPAYATPQDASVRPELQNKPPPPSMLRKGLFGSTYIATPDPNANIDNQERARQLLQGQAEMDEKFASGPLTQFFFQGDAQDAAKRAAQTRMMMDKIDREQMQDRAVQVEAQNAGLDINPKGNEKIITETLVQRMMSGDPIQAQKAAEVLTARGYGALVTGMETQMTDNIDKKVKERDDLKNKLDSAHNDDVYNKLRDEVNDQIPNFAPKTRAEWEAKRGQLDDAYRRAMLAVERHRQLRAQQGDYQPETNEAAAKIYAGKATNYDNTPMEGATGVSHANGTNGGQGPSGSIDIPSFGEKWKFWNPTTYKAADEMGKSAYPTTERTKNLGVLRTIKLAETDPETGKPMTEKKLQKLINTNPEVVQAVREAFAAASREGGGATAGLVKMGLQNQGPLQEGFDKLLTAWAGGKAVITGNHIQQYLSKATQGQIRYVLDMVKKNTEADAAARLGPMADYAGKLGADPSEIPVEPEIQEMLRNRMMIAREKNIQHMADSPHVPSGDTNVWVGKKNDATMQIPGVKSEPMPASAFPHLYPELHITPPPATPPATPPAAVPAPPAPAATPVATPPAAVPAAVPQPYNPRLGKYGGTVATPPAAVPAPAPVATPPVVVPQQPLTPEQQRLLSVNPQTRMQAATGSPLAPNAPTVITGLPPATAPAAAGTPQQPRVVLQGGPTARPAAPVATAPARPVAPVATPPSAAPSVPPTVPTSAAPGGPGTSGTPPAAPAPAGSRGGGTFSEGVPSGGFPGSINNNQVARTVYGVTGQTVQNVLQGKNPNATTIANNAAIVATSSANSESSFNPNLTHDGGIGYGLYGHNGDRLAEMRRWSGISSGPIPPVTQAAFFAREMSTAADRDPFIARVLSNPNPTAEDLTRVQIRMEQPKGYKGPGTEEQADNWSGRLAHTRELMGGSGGGTPVAAGGGQPAATRQPVSLPYPNPTSPQQALANYRAGQRETPQESAAYQDMLNKRAMSATTAAADIAPAAGMMIGSTLGSAAGPAGTVGGGTIGGAIGGGIKNYFTGQDQSLGGYAKEAGWGGVQGAVGSIPGLGPVATGARVIGSGIVPAAKKWIETGDVNEALDTGGGAMLGAAGGEMFGRALGAAGYGLWKAMGTGAKGELAKIARTLATEEPKVMDATGKMVVNTKYQDAVDRAKQLHQDPDNLAHAHNQVTAKIEAGEIPATKGEAVATMPGQVAQVKAGRELQNIEEQVGAQQARPTPPYTPKVVHDPASLIGTKGIADTQAVRDGAKEASTWLNAKANNVQEEWHNSAKARTGLLARWGEIQEQAAKNPTAGQTHDMKALRAMADKVRDQQRVIATRMYPNQPDKVNKLMDHLDDVSNTYRQAVMTSKGDIIKTLAAGDERSREVQAAVNKLTKNDPDAKQMIDALTLLHKKKEMLGGGKGLALLAVQHGIPFVGPHVVKAITGLGAAGSYKLLKAWWASRGSGNQAAFGDLIKNRLQPRIYIPRTTGAAVGAQTGATAVDWGKQDNEE